MLKTIINSYIKAVLRDLFEDAAKGAMKLSLGDLFSKSDLLLNNLTLRADAFDAGLHPLKLVSGHISQLHVEGIAEAYMGGNVRVVLDGLYLLFNIDMNADIEQVQIMKKILIEMKYETISQTLWKELMQRIQGISVGTPDYKKHRKQLLSTIKNAFKNVHITVKSVHIRIEAPSATADSCIAVGWSLPYLTVQPNSNGGGTSLRGRLSQADKALAFNLKSLQMYCDYDTASYTSNGSTHANIASEFKRRAKSEKHISLITPFDVEIVVAADLRSKTGIVTPQVGIHFPGLKIVCDSRQIEALNDLLDLMVFAQRRSRLHLLMPVYNERKVAPFVCDVGGVHLLPSLNIGGVKYPEDVKMPKCHISRIKAYFKAKSKTWALDLWRFVVGIVIDDLRLIRPLGRWIELVKLPILRRKYAFYFSKLLKKNETGDYVFDVKIQLDPSILQQLFSIEMTLSISTVLMFRTFGVMVCAVKEFNDKYRQAKGIAKGTNANSADKSKLLQWKDIVRIHSEVLETYRALEREEEVEMMDDESVDDVDDTVSALTDDASFSSPKANKSFMDMSAQGADAMKVISSFSIISKAKTAFSRKDKGHTDTIHEDQDEADAHSFHSKSPARIPKSATSSLLGNMPNPLSAAPFKAMLSSSGEAKFGTGLGISEAIQWVIPRHHSLISIIPPDVYLTIGDFNAVFRQYVLNNSRKNIVSLNLHSVVGALTISSPVLGNNQDGSSFDKSVGGFASLTGALIQFRLTVESADSQIAIVKDEVESLPKPIEIVSRKSKVTQYINSSGDEDSYSISDEPEEDTETDNISTSELSKFYGDSPSVVDARPSASSAPQDTMVSFFASKAKEQFVLLCIVLDNDIKKKGAADVQVQFGEANVSLDGLTLASLVNGSSLIGSNGRRAIEALKELFQLLTLAAEKSLLVDLDSRAPLVLMSLVSEDDDVSDGRELVLTKSDHKAVVGHMNYEYWLSILEDNIPKFVTICARTSKIKAEFLNYAQIKGIIASKVQLKADRAAAAAPNRRKPIAQLKSKKSKGAVMKALYDIRRFGFREGRVEETEGGRMKLELDPLDIVFAKTNDPPLPLISLNMLGTKLSVPIDDDTLCHALAMVLAKTLPMFV